jgi:undecaprenyl-diphosphatase
MPVPHLTRSSRRGRWMLASTAFVLLGLAVVHATIGASPARAETSTIEVAGAATETAAAPLLTPDEKTAANNEMNIWKAMVLGAVEGVTEFLPISSTGHLVVTQRILGIGTNSATKDAADTYAIAIQFGAILAVVLLYWRRIVTMVKGVIGQDPAGRRLLIALVLAFLPAVIVGLLFEKSIKSHLLGPPAVIAAWLVGGVVLLIVAPRIRPDRRGMRITEIDWRHALIIGAAQVLAMWPGTSRSLVTILAALAVGTTLSAAVEFSFLLGLMTLGAATLYESVKNGSTVIDAYGWVDPLVGMIVAFVFAVVSIRWMVTWLQTRSLAVFGWERIAAAALTIGLLAAGTIS